MYHLWSPQDTLLQAEGASRQGQRLSQTTVRIGTWCFCLSACSSYCSGVTRSLCTVVSLDLLAYFVLYSVKVETPRTDHNPSAHAAPSSPHRWLWGGAALGRRSSEPVASTMLKSSVPKIGQPQYPLQPLPHHPSKFGLGPALRFPVNVDL